MPRILEQNPLSAATTAAIVGWTLSAIFVAFMLGASALPKLAGMPVAAQTMADLGWPDAPVFWIGVLEAGLAILFLWQRTALLAAVLMMGILGGAMATPDSRRIHRSSPTFYSPSILAR